MRSRVQLSVTAQIKTNWRFHLAVRIPASHAGYTGSSPVGATYMVGIVQLVRASDCGSECRGFEPHYPPFFANSSSFKIVEMISHKSTSLVAFFVLYAYIK